MNKLFIKEINRSGVKKYCVCYWGNMGSNWGLASVTIKEFDTKKEAKDYIELENGATK